MGREGQEGVPGMDGAPGKDGSKGMPVRQTEEKTLFHVPSSHFIFKFLFLLR